MWILILTPVPLVFWSEPVWIKYFLVVVLTPGSSGCWPYIGTFF